MVACFSRQASVGGWGLPCIVSWKDRGARGRYGPGCISIEALSELLHSEVGLRALLHEARGGYTWFKDDGVWWLFAVLVRC
jgi:hypothetical protein